MILLSISIRFVESSEITAPRYLYSETESIVLLLISGGAVVLPLVTKYLVLSKFMFKPLFHKFLIVFLTYNLCHHCLPLERPGHLQTVVSIGVHLLYLRPLFYTLPTIPLVVTRRTLAEDF